MLRYKTHAACFTSNISFSGETPAKEAPKRGLSGRFLPVCTAQGAMRETLNVYAGLAALCIAHNALGNDYRSRLKVKKTAGLGRVSV
jgi:hypothetical protein